MKMKRILICFWVLLVCQYARCQKPWTFWYWMYGAVSKEGIKADLEAMKNVGLGGCYLMPIRGVEDKPEYGGTAQQLTPPFWEMVDYAFGIADQLELEMGIHVSDGFALAGGPWFSPEESMQKIVFCDTIVDGGQTGFLLPRPRTATDYYEDIACFALPVSGTTSVWYDEPAVSLPSTMQRDEKGVFRCNDKSSYIDYDFGTPSMVRTIEVSPGGNNIQSQRLKVLASDDGQNYHEIYQMQPPRQGWQTDGYSFTYSIPPTEARYYRLSWSAEGTEPGSEDLDAAKWRPNLKISRIRFSALPRVHQYEGKAGYVWRIAPSLSEQQLPASDCFRLKDIHRVLLKEDCVTNKLPKGKWLLLRVGHTTTGHTNATAGGGKGLECDKFSTVAVEKQIAHWFGEFKKRKHAGVVKYLHVDSWECGSQNWSDSFAGEFKSRRHYNLIPYLPLLCGYPIESGQESERVLRDVRKTIAELLNECFFSTVEQYAHAHDCFLSTESVAPTMVSDGLSHYRYADAPMGEFWLNSPTHDKPNDMLDAISGAHIYGKRTVQAEGFTEVRGVWNETPALIKPLLDREFALGMNQLFFHVFTHNPWMDRQPGMTLDGIGLFFQRDQTWFPEAKGLVDYITRCQQILQDRMPVVDIAVFTGEEIPSRSLRPDQLVDILPGIIGKERVEKEMARRANVGLPMEESPVGVNHAAGIVDPQDWCNALQGYHYDCINADALLRLSSVQDGRLNLPGGASYRILVIPGKTSMNPSATELSAEVKEKISFLRQQGVVVVDEPYLQDDFSQFDLPRDAELPSGMDFIHLPDELSGERYFLTNQENRQRQIKVSFRVDNPDTVVLYNPLSRKYYRPTRVEKKGGRTSVELQMAPYGSLFVICSNLVGYSNLHSQTYSDSLNIDGTWQISFERNGQRLETDTLPDWSKNVNPLIRYYSGYATYTAKTVLKGFNGQTSILRLDRLHDVARVYVNGHDCGVVWAPPYEVDITDALKPGKNTLSIKVVNTWANALRGSEEGTPPFDHIWTNAKYRTKSDQLLPAGLLGPVKIMFE